MSTDIFLGGLASLILVAVIIVTLTTGKRSEYSARNDKYEKRPDNGRAPKSDR